MSPELLQEAALYGDVYVDQTLQLPEKHLTCHCVSDPQATEDEPDTPAA